MQAKTVCISRTLAAGGAEVGRLVAEQLDYRYLDDEIIALASERAQIDPTTLAAVEHRESVVSRLLDVLTDLTAHRPKSALGFTQAGNTPSSVPQPPPARADARRLIREVILELGEQGKVVIVAHAASIPLAGRDGVLRVFVTAPEAVRARRLELEVRIVNEREALKTIQESDRARLDYLRAFYGIDEESPTLYDVVVNTEALNREAAAAIIVSAARTLG